MTKQEAASFLNCNVNDDRNTIFKKCNEKEAELHRLYPRNTRYNQLGEELENLRLAKQILLSTPVSAPKPVEPLIPSQGMTSEYQPSSQTITQNSAPKQPSFSKIIIGISAVLTPILLIVILFMYLGPQTNQALTDTPPSANIEQNDSDNFSNNASLPKEELIPPKEDVPADSTDDSHESIDHEIIFSELKIEDPKIEAMIKEVLDEAEEIYKDAKSWEDIYLDIENHIHTESEHKFGHPEGYTLLVYAAKKAMKENRSRAMRERMRKDVDNKAEIAKLSLGHYHWEEVVQALYKKDEAELLHVLSEVYHNWHEILEGPGELDRHHDDH